MTKNRTAEQLREMVRRGLRAVGHEVTAEVEEAMAEVPERVKRPTPEQRGMSEAAMMRMRADEIAWFNQHPSELEYVRRMIPGEFPPDVTAEWVKVIKLTADANERVRQPVVRVPGPDGIVWEPWKSGARPGTRTQKPGV